MRPVERHDVAAIGAIYREAVALGTASFELDPPDDDEMGRRMASLVAGGFPYWVASAGETCLGFAHAGPYRSRPAYRFTLEDSIYLAAPARGLGLGRRLLARIVEDSAARGFRQMIAIIGDSANHASVGLHRALGFRLVGTLEAVGWKHGLWLDSIVMQLGLGGGSAAPPVETGKTPGHEAPGDESAGTSGAAPRLDGRRPVGDPRPSAPVADPEGVRQG